MKLKDYLPPQCDTIEMWLLQVIADSEFGTFHLEDGGEIDDIFTIAGEDRP